MKYAAESRIDIDRVVASYRQLLDKLYLEELPYARLIDESDLVIRAEGRATETYEPRVSALSHLLDRLRDESQRLAKVIAGMAEETRVSNIDLLLSGLARGSLVVGLKLAPPTPDPRQQTFLPEDEPVFEAVKQAIRSLSAIPHYLTVDGVREGLEEVIKNPAVRDATLLTAQRLAPSGRGGIESLTISSPGFEAGILTSGEKHLLRRALARPQFRHPHRGTFVGVVRELDLDAKRFEIRKVKQIGTIRCVLGELETEKARRWLDRVVKVNGTYEADEHGRPRLLRAENVGILSEQSTKKLL